MRQHLTTTVPMPRWWVYLVLLAFVLDDIANENWTGLAVFVVAFIVGTLYFSLRAWRYHRDQAR